MEDDPLYQSGGASSMHRAGYGHMQGAEEAAHMDRLMVSHEAANPAEGTHEAADPFHTAGLQSQGHAVVQASDLDPAQLYAAHAGYVHTSTQPNPGADSLPQPTQPAAGPVENLTYVTIETASGNGMVPALGVPVHQHVPASMPRGPAVYLGHLGLPGGHPVLYQGAMPGMIPLQQPGAVAPHGMYVYHMPANAAPAAAWGPAVNRLGQGMHQPGQQVSMISPPIFGNSLGTATLPLGFEVSALGSGSAAPQQNPGTSSLHLLSSSGEVAS
jgi:hypothetical protein